MRSLKVLLVGVGTVGEAIARLSADKPWLEQMVLADFNVERARTVQSRITAGARPAGVAERFPVAFLDASTAGAVAALAREHKVDLVVNAADPRFVPPIFDGALAAGVDYIDMAVSLSEPHPTKPFSRPGVLLGEHQFARAQAWREAGRRALLGVGMDPGLTDVFAAYARKHLFDEVHEAHVRDGGDLHIEGFAFAPVFSIWTTIEECLNPPLLWDASRGGHLTTEPFSAPEQFRFPEGVGPVECVNVEHEEVVMLPRGIPGLRRASFKYALGRDFINVLRTLHAVGLDSTKPVTVKGLQVAPRDVVAALVPDPAQVGDRMKGRAIVGTWIIGRKDGHSREVYLYQRTVGEESWSQFGLQAVAWQTGFNPVVAMELVAREEWTETGVLIPEQLDPDPFLATLDRWGIHWAVEERTPGEQIPT